MKPTIIIEKDKITYENFENVKGLFKANLIYNGRKTTIKMKKGR